MLAYAAYKPTIKHRISFYLQKKTPDFLHMCKICCTFAAQKFLINAYEKMVMDSDGSSHYDRMWTKE